MRRERLARELAPYNPAAQPPADVILTL